MFVQGLGICVGLSIVGLLAMSGAISVASAQPQAQALYDEALTALPNRDELQRLLDQAIELDPDFAPAYALKAEQYALAVAATVAASYDSAQASALAELAIETAERALALDASSVRAYLALGLTHRQYWRWPAALDAFARAYELAPHDPSVLFNYGWLSSFAGSHERAVEIAAQGIALAPSSANAHRDLGIAHAYAGNPEASAAALRECLRLDANIGVCHIYLGFALLRQEDYAAAEFSLREAERLFGATPSPAAISSLAHAYMRTGRPEDAARLFDRLTGRATRGVVGAGSWPLAYLAIGDQERAYEWLNRAVLKIERNQPDEGFFNLMIIKANVQANPVLDEPRFAALRARIGYNQMSE